MKTINYIAICFVLIHLCIPAVFAQQDDGKIWASIQQVQQTTNKTEKLSLLQKLALELAPIAPSEAIGYAQDGLSISHDDYTAQAQFYLALGIANFYGETLGKATQYLQKISKLKNVLPTTQIQAWQYLAMCMARDDDKRNADKYFEKAYKEAEKINNKDLLAQIALFRAESENGAQALPHYQNALALFEVTRNEIGYAQTAQAIGDFYAEQMNVPLTALFYYQKVLAISDRLGEKRLLSNALNNIADLYLHKQNDPKTALRYYFQTFVIAQEYDFIQNGSKLGQALKGIYTSYQNLSKKYRNEGDTEKAREYDKLADRYQVLRQGLAKADYDVQLFSIASPEPRSYTSPSPDRPRKNAPAETLRKSLRADTKNVLSDSKRKADSLVMAEKDAQIDHWQTQSSKQEAQMTDLHDEKQQHETELKKYRNLSFWGLVSMIGILAAILVYAVYHLRLQKNLIARQKQKVQEAQEKANRYVIVARENEDVALQKGAEVAQVLAMLDDKKFENASFRKILQEDVLRHTNTTSLARQERASYALSSLLQDNALVTAHVENQPIAPCIQQAVGKVAHILKEQQIKIEQHIDETLFCNFDAVLLENVFIHLLQNSCKYVAPDGQIRIEAREEEKGILLTYKDNGQGVPAKLHSQVFSKFPVQDARPLAHGLYQAKQLMEAQKGSISLLPNAMGMTVLLKFAV